MADIKNSTAVTAAPVQQSSDSTPDQVTNPPAPTPTQVPTPTTSTDVSDYTSNPTSTPQPDPRGGVMAGGGATQPQTQPQIETGDTDPVTAGTGVGDKMPLVATKPLTAAPAGSEVTPSAPPTRVQRLLSKAREISAGMVGEQYKTEIGLDGVAHRTEVPMSGRSMALAFALEALEGGLAGAGAHGTAATGEAAAAGLQQGEKIAAQRKDVQEQADQKAQQDHIRQYQAIKTNLEVAQTMQAIGKHDFDVANSPVELNATAMKYWRENTPEKIGDPDVGEKDSLDTTKYPATEYFRVPTMTVPRQDPNTGLQTWQDSHGAAVPPGTPWAHAAWDHRYAMIHRDADVSTHDDEGNLDPGLQAQIDAGVESPEMAKAGQTTKIPAGAYLQNNAKVTRQNAADTLINGPHGVVALVNHYRQLVTKDPSKAAPNAVDPATDNVFDLFGGNTSKLSDFIEQHEQGSGVQANGQPTRGVRDNNPGNLVADKSWIDGGGKVDDKNLPSGQAPFRVYDSKEDGKKALDDQLLKWKKDNPNQSINSFFSRYTTPGQVGPDGMNDQQRYIQQALQTNGATDATQQAGQMSPVNLKQFMKDNPDSDRALQAFQRAFYTNNPTASMQKALDNIKDARMKSIVIKMLGNDPTVAGDYDSSRLNEKTAIMEQTRNQAKFQYNDQKRKQEENGILDRNKDTINAILNGSAIDLRGILTMRAYDREIVTNELIKRSNGAYNPASIQNMIDLNKEINDQYTVGSFGNQVQGYQTAFGHTAAADQDLKTLQTFFPQQDISPYINKPVNEVYRALQGINPDAAKQFVKYQINLHNATTDWQNLLNNGHALHQEDKDIAQSIITDKTPFTTAHAALGTMMSSAATRINSLNDRYANTMSTATQRANYPSMIAPATVDAIRKVNDTETMQQVARLRSGGTITGGPRGLGNEGTEVGLMLTPKAPQQGAAPTPAIVAEYARVYGKTDPGGAPSSGTIKKALAANGWNVGK